MSNDLCAVILAGGLSRRMGCNKALLDVGGRPLIDVLIERIRPLTNQIIISSNDHESYRFLEFPVVADCYAGQGPLAGFHAAMHRQGAQLYVMLACDLPNVQTSFLHRLVSLSAGYDAAIPRTQDGTAHPLCAVYRRTCLRVIDRALERGANKVIETFGTDEISVRWVGPVEGRFSDLDLANINAPEDLPKLIPPPSP